MTSPTLITVSQACQQWKISPRTMQRRIQDGKIDATRDGQGHYLVTVAAMHAAKIPVRETWKTDAKNDATPNTTHSTYDATQRDISNRTQANTGDTAATSDATELATLRAELRDITRQRDHERELRQAAERNAEDLRTALRMIEPPRPTQEAPPGAEPQAPQRKVPRRWFPWAKS